MARTSSKYFATVIAKLLDAKRKENIIIDEKFQGELRAKIMARAAGAMPESEKTEAVSASPRVYESKESAAAEFIRKWRYALALVPSALLVFMVSALVMQLPVNVDTETVIPGVTQPQAERERVKRQPSQDEGMGVLSEPESEVTSPEDSLPILLPETEDVQQPGQETGEDTQDEINLEAVPPVKQIPSVTPKSPTVSEPELDEQVVQQEYMEPLQVTNDNFSWLRNLVLFDLFFKRQMIRDEGLIQPLVQQPEQSVLESDENLLQLEAQSFLQQDLDSPPAELPPLQQKPLAPKVVKKPVEVKDFPVHIMANLMDEDINYIKINVINKLDKAKVKEVYVYTRANNIIEININFKDGSVKFERLHKNYRTGTVEPEIETPEMYMPDNFYYQQEYQYQMPFQYERLYRY
jgi:hypothetical protein